jgi:hypothetical protein
MIFSDKIGTNIADFDSTFHAQKVIIRITIANTLATKAVSLEP